MLLQCQLHALDGHQRWVAGWLPLHSRPHKQAYICKSYMKATCMQTTISHTTISMSTFYAANSTQHVATCRMLNNADSLQKALSFVACGTWGDTSIEIASYIAAYLQKAWRLRNRCKHVGVPVHVVSPMHVGSAVHVGVAVHAVHVDSAEARGRWQ